jgi:RND family efflux transporter MFP subunit
MLATLALSAGCRPGENAAPPPLPVTTAEVQQAQIPLYLEHVGTTEAVSTVEVRARVRGVLEKVLFKEGAEVEKDALLFVIEQKPYRAALDKAQADLQRARASLERAQADYDRTAELTKKEVSSQADLDHARAARDEAAASVQAAKAAVEQAQLDMDYTEIHAPIAGRIGRMLVDRGNLVGASEQTPLATIVQLDPIYIYWSPSERERLDVLRQRKEGRYVQRDEIEVRALLADGSEHPFPGRLDFVDNTVDPNAGTLRVRAVFPNPDKSLLPGQYANLRILVGRNVPVLLVPASAIIEEQGGSTVYVVTPEGTIQPRAVVASSTYEQMRVIDSGLQPGERIAVDNLGKLRPGMKVAEKPSDSTASESKP